MSADPQHLIQLLREHAVRTGEFILASGKRSDFYVDARLVTLHAEGSRIVGDLILQRLRPEVVEVGGLTMGADPIASSICTLSTLRGRPTHAFLIRKQPKQHGTGQYLEGLSNVAPGSAVCILEDTTTTGGSLLLAAERATEAGLNVVQCITVVDREEGASEALAEAGYTLEALATRTSLLSENG